jgi:hypothetical protein
MVAQMEFAKDPKRAATSQLTKSGTCHVRLQLACNSVATGQGRRSTCFDIICENFHTRVFGRNGPRRGCVSRAGDRAGLRSKCQILSTLAMARQGWVQRREILPSRAFDLRAPPGRPGISGWADRASDDFGARSTRPSASAPASKVCGVVRPSSFASIAC